MMNLIRMHAPARKLKEELEFAELDKEDAVEKQDYERAARLRDDINELQTKLSEALAQVSRKVPVTAEDVAEVVSSWTGIPLAKLTEWRR